MDIRKVALVAFIASVLGMVRPSWDAAHRMTARGVTGSMWWVIPAILFITLVSAIMPVFYFALYRDEGTMRFPRPLRKLALVAAVAYLIATALRLQAWDGYWHVSTAVGLLANFAYILLLVSMSRESGEVPSAQVPPSDLLSTVTKLAVIAWGIWVAFQVVRLPYVAFTYPFMKRIAYQVGRSAPSLREMLTDVLLTFFSQASLLAAPYIVWRSGFGRGTPQSQSL